MKLDSIINPTAPDIVSEATQGRRYGKYQLLGSWSARTAIDARSFRSTIAGAPVGPPGDIRPDSSPFFTEHGNWGEQDDGRGLKRGAMPVSIRLALNPDPSTEGDE